ncbi:MAG: glycosyltransferase family 9 protein [Deltaproteobacteria bacterium]|nr:glycosyltransferase family 9 protein [Deltaproteobacteria bacterium]
MLIKGSPVAKERVKKILIIQLGDIGDIVWAIPTFGAVKKFYDKAHLSLLLRGGMESLLAGDPLIDSIFEVKGRARNFLNRIKEDITLIRMLRRENFDIVFDLRFDDRGAYMARFTGAPVRVAQYSENPSWRNRFFTHLVKPPVSKEPVRGAAEQSLKIVREFGIESKDHIPKIRISEEVLSRSSQLLREAGINEDKRWITLNPFSRWQYKEWKYEKWVQIIEWLRTRYDIATVIVGVKEEREQAEYIAGRCAGAVFNLAGKTQLDELAGILSLSRLHVGVDSAAPHIAAATGTPTVMIYGPSSWRDWAPIGEEHTVIAPDCDCAPCHKKGCGGKGWSRCLEELEVDKVKDLLEKRINLSRLI